MLSNGDLPNLVCLCQKARQSCQTQIHDENIVFDIGVKGQGRTEVMDICDTSNHGDPLNCKS